jgi:hypothetical protein
MARAKRTAEVVFMMFSEKKEDDRMNTDVRKFKAVNLVR